MAPIQITEGHATRKEAGRAVMVVVMINLFSNRRSVCKGESPVMSAQKGSKLLPHAKLSVFSFEYFKFGEASVPERNPSVYENPVGLLASFLTRCIGRRLRRLSLQVGISGASDQAVSALAEEGPAGGYGRAASVPCWGRKHHQKSRNWKAGNPDLEGGFQNSI